MRCASCARDYAHGAELRAGGPQLPYLLAMAAASLSCPRLRPRPCHSRRPSPVAWDPIVEQLKLYWSNYACRMTGSTRETNNQGCPPHAQKDCKCGEDASAEVRLLARVAAAARARKDKQEEQADAS